MIAFTLRFISLFFILGLLCLGFLFFGEVDGDFLSLLLELTFEDVPTLILMISLIATFSFFISLWMSVNEKRKEFNILRSVNQLSDSSFHLKKRTLSRTLEKALTETNELIETQRKSLQRLTSEKVEANDKMIQERIIAERQRLARELHDSVSQQLFAASMMLSALTEQEEDNGNMTTLQQIEKIVQQAQLEMRALLLHLRPIALHDNTLSEGLRELISELQQKVYFQIDMQIEDIELSKAEEDHLFRIAQEALSNTLRHSKAKEVELLLIARDDVAILRIQDNGIGFTIEEDKSTSYGLKNIAERAVEIGCKYKVVSVPGEGTLVEVKVPLTKKSDNEVTE